MCLTRGNHLRSSRKRDRSNPRKIPWMSLFPARNLDPLLPREEIVEKMIHHANLILPRPWNQVERVYLGSWGFRKGRARERASWGWWEGLSWWGRERESDLNDVGPQNSWNPFNRSDRLLWPVRPVQPEPSQVWQRIQLLVCHIDLRLMCRD